MGGERAMAVKEVKSAMNVVQFSVNTALKHVMSVTRITARTVLGFLSALLLVVTGSNVQDAGSVEEITQTLQHKKSTTTSFIVLNARRIGVSIVSLCPLRTRIVMVACVSPRE